MIFRVAQICLETGRFLILLQPLIQLYRAKVAYGAHLRWALALTGSLCLFSAAQQAATVPAGALLEIRLQQEINSYSASAGKPVQAVLIAPVTVHGEILIPAGSVVKGTVKNVQRVGAGIIHETATIHLHFDQLQLPDGSVSPIEARLTEVENARETVDKQGKIRGIRSTGTPGYRAAGLLTSLAAVDPISLAFSTAAR